MRNVFAALMLICATPEVLADDNATPHELLWQSENVQIPGGGRGSHLIASEDGVTIATANLGAYSITTGASLIMPETHAIQLASDEHFATLQNPEFQYFNNGTFGRLALGQLGSPALRTIDGLGEISPRAIVHRNSTTWLAYSRDDETSARIVSVADGRTRGQVSARLPLSGDGAMHLSIDGNTLTLVSAHETPPSERALHIQLLDIDAVTLAPTRRLEGRIENIPAWLNSSILPADGAAWFVHGATMDENIVWRVTTAAARLVATEIFRADTLGGWSTFAATDGQALYLVKDSGRDDALQVTRITDIDTSTQILPIPCATGPSTRYSALLTSQGPPHLLISGPNNCAALWRLR